MIDLTDVVSAIITLLCALISAFLIPYLKSKVDAERLAKIQKWVNVAVEAAEMIYKGAGRGEEKKAYVKACLEAHGYALDVDEIENLIESAVYDLNFIKIVENNEIEISEADNPEA